MRRLGKGQGSLLVKKIYSEMEIEYLQCGHGLLVVAVWGERVDLFKKVLRMGFDVNETCSVR